MNLKQFFSREGYDITEKLNWDKNIELWESWYKGKVRKFHTYYIYNGQTKVKMEKKSLQGAKKVSEDWADLLFNEKVTINLKDDNSTKQLNEIIKKINLSVIVNQGLERTFALGTGAFVVSVQDINHDIENNILDVTNSKAYFEFVEAKKIIPLTWQGNNITECAFVTMKNKKGATYIYIAMHILENEKYVIKNFMFKGKYSSFVEANDEEKEGFIDKFETGSEIPWFQIITPNICNNIDSETPFGLSIFANAIDTLQSLDNAYDGMDNEVLLGRRRTFISEEMMTYDNGEEKLTFDPNDISVYRMPKGFNKDSMIQHSDPSLRTEEYKNAVNFQLNILSSKVGFGQERYKFDGSSIQTATGVISENSDMYRTIKKHEQTLENSLKTIIKAISYASSVFGNYNIDASEITIDFDDSIIEDRGAEQVRDMQEVSQGLRSKKSYLMKNRSMNEKQAEDELKAINEEKQSNVEMFSFKEEE